MKTAIPFFLLMALGCVGCNKDAAAPPPPVKKTTIQNIGSDTMVNLAQAWAEAYAKIDPTVSIEVAFPCACILR